MRKRKQNRFDHIHLAGEMVKPENETKNEVIFHPKDELLPQMTIIEPYVEKQVCCSQHEMLFNENYLCGLTLVMIDKPIAIDYSLIFRDVAIDCIQNMEINKISMDVINPIFCKEILQMEGIKQIFYKPIATIHPLFANTDLTSVKEVRVAKININYSTTFQNRKIGDDEGVQGSAKICGCS